MRKGSFTLPDVLERTIEDIALDFVGEGAFRFVTERDVQAVLLGRLRDNVVFHVMDGDSRRDLVHAECPCYGIDGSSYHDLVIWRPSKASQARKCWGKTKGKWPEDLRRSLHLVAIEIERFAGLPWGLTKGEVLSRNVRAIVRAAMLANDDIAKLRNGWSDRQYFLMFWDEDADKEHLLKFEQHLEPVCQTLAQQTGICFYLVSREKGVVFKAC